MSTLTLIKQVINKMGLKEEPRFVEKTSELLRLLDLRSSNLPLQINEYSKIVLCVDLVSSYLDSIYFNQDQAAKLSSLRKTQYIKYKRLFERLLDLGKIPNIDDICTQLGLNEVTRKADELLNLFVNAEGNQNLDAGHPQYAAMAVFQACNLLHIKVYRSSLLPFSNLKLTQWQKLEQQWNHKLTCHFIKNNSSNAFGLKDIQTVRKKLHENKVTQLHRVRPEDYEDWKSRLLMKARAQLNNLDSNEPRNLTPNNTYA